MKWEQDIIEAICRRKLINLMDVVRAFHIMPITVTGMIESGDLKIYGNGVSPDDVDKVAHDFMILEWFEDIPDKIKEWEDQSLAGDDVKLRARRPKALKDRF